MIDYNIKFRLKTYIAEKNVPSAWGKMLILAF